MNIKLLLFLVGLFAMSASGCSVLGTHMYVETLSGDWTTAEDTETSAYYPVYRMFFICDSIGFMSFHFSDCARISSVGLPLLPVFPSSSYYKDCTMYTAWVTIQTTKQVEATELMKYIHFSFNGLNTPTQSIGYDSAYVADYNHRPPYFNPPCYRRVHSSGAINLQNTCILFQFNFDVHRDSIKTMAVTFDEELNRQLGTHYTPLELTTEDQTFYKPFTLLAH